MQIPPERLDQIAHRFAELEARMASGTLEGEAFVRASRDYAELEPVAKIAAEVKAARKVKVPDNMIRRVIQFARQGYTSIHFPIFDTDWDSEAYRTVSGQNSNNSVRVTDEFLRAVEADDDFDLTLRKNGAATALTCTIVDGASSCSDLVNSVAFADGDLLSLGYTETNNPNVRIKYSILYQAP